MAQLIGRVKIDLGGIKVRIEKGATLDVGGPERAEMMDTDGDFHFTEAINPSVCEFSVLHAEADDMIAIHALKNVRLSFIADNGVVYVVDRATSMTPPKIDDSGKCPFKFCGNPAIRQ